MPGSVTMILETRSTDEAALLQFEQELWRRIEGELQDRGLRLTRSLLKPNLTHRLLAIDSEHNRGSIHGGGLQKHPVAKWGGARRRLRRSHCSHGHDLCALPGG